MRGVQKLTTQRRLYSGGTACPIKNEMMVRMRDLRFHFFTSDSVTIASPSILTGSPKFNAIRIKPRADALKRLLKPFGLLSEVTPGE